MFLVDRLILVAGILLLFAIASSKFSSRMGMPVLILFLGVGMLAGEKLPSRVPGHPDCESSDGLVRDTRDGDASMTVYFVGCPGPQFIVERVVQLTSNRLLWVQVRSDDRRTANRVLASVDTIGI